MTTQDDFDSELDSNDIDGENFDAEPSAADSAPPRKKRSGFLFLLVFLGLVGGGGYYAVKTLGIHVPYLNPAPAPSVAASAGAADVAGTPSMDMADTPSTDMAAMPSTDMAAMPPPVMAADPLAPESATTDPAPIDPLAADPLADPMTVNSAAADPLTADSEDAVIDPLTGLPLDGAPAPAAAPAEAAAPATDVSALVNETPAASPVAMPDVAMPPVSAPDPLVTAAPQAEQAPPPMPANAPQAPAVNTALEARLHNLEQKLGALESMQVTRLDFEALRNELAALKSAPPARAGRNSDDDYNNSASSAPDSGHDEAPPATPKPRIKKAVTKPAAPKAPVVTTWVLKSAKPGTAWVAQKGSNELKMVTVGSTLPGIGKVTSIRQNAAGKWVVNGSKGQINQ